MASCVWKLSLPLPFDLLLEPAAAQRVLEFARLISAANSIRFGSAIWCVCVCACTHKGLVRVRMNANIYGIVAYRMSLAQGAAPFEHGRGALNGSEHF